MKTKICVILVVLLSFSGVLSSQEIQSRACVSTFENQTVSSQASVLGCSTLTSKNVTVTNTGNLSLYAPENVTLNGNFEVKLGGVLNIMGNQSQKLKITYAYDESGNRTGRIISVTASSGTTGADAVE